MKKSTFQNHKRFSVWLKTICLLLVASWSLSTNAQIAVTVTNPTNTTPNLSATYPSLASALAGLNAVTAMSGPVVLTCTGGTSETAPATGLTIGSTTLNPVLSSVNTVTINKTSGTVTLNAGVGTATPATAGAHDGILNLVGADFITIDGLSFVDGNTTNPATMEYGIGLFKASVTDGCQNNTIQNCSITLNRLNFATGGALAIDGSKGINIVNSTQAAQTVALTITAASGSNSNNKIYSNTIQNCNSGISLIGFAAATPFTLADQSNDIGGTSSSTGNNIINFGGGASATNTANGIRTLAQYGLNISFNTINNNNGSGVNHVVAINGVLVGAATSASATINNNTITLKGGGTTSALTAISNASGSTATTNTININNNIITGCTYTTATSATFTGITSSSSAANLNMNGNQFTNNTSNTSGSVTMLVNSGTVTTGISISNNTINGFTYTASNSGTFTGVSCSSGASTATVNLNGNNFQSITHSVAGSTSYNFISCGTGSPNIQNFNSNTFTALNLNTTGSVTFIAQSASLSATAVENMNNNSIVTSFNKGGAGGTIAITTTNASTPAGAVINFQNNNFSNMTFTGATTFIGYNNTDGGAPTKVITGNTFNNITGGTSAITCININFNGTGTNMSNNTITNITGQSSVTGCALGGSGTATTMLVSNNTITNLSSTGSGSSVLGLSCASVATTSCDVFGNTIKSLSTTGGSSVVGLSCSQAIGNIYKNSVCDLSGSNAASTINGLLISGGTTLSIYNNRIGDLKAPVANASNAIIGLNITGGTTVKAYFNTVQLSATSTGALFGSSALSVSTSPALTLNDNIFVNNSNANGAGLAVAYRRSTTTLTSYSSTSDRNLFYAGTPSSTHLIFTDGTNSFQTLGTYKALASLAPRDANSVTENPNFLSTTCGNADFLKINLTIPTQIESGGINIAGITDDYLGTIRQGNSGYAGTGTAPDLGAIEFEGVPFPACTGTPAASTITGATPICSGLSASLGLSDPYAMAGITYQWASSLVSGGPYTTTLGISPTQSTGALTATTYYVCTITCTNSGLAYTTPQQAVLVNSLPTIASTSSSSSICNPGGTAVTLNATGALSYVWSPATGLSGTTGSSVSSNPGATTTYTISGTDANGCINTATTTVTVGTYPVAVSITPSSPSLCSSSPINLTASGGTVGGGPVTLGTATTLTGATTQPTAFCNRWAQYWNQTIYTAAELTSAGLNAGSVINSITYTTTTQGDANSNANFKIRIGNTTNSVLTSFLTTPMTTVYGPATYTHAIGANTIPFSTFFVWDGVSNIVIEVLHDGADITNNAITTFTAAADNKNIEAHTSTTSSTTAIQSLVSSGSVTANPSTTRLNIILGRQLFLPTWSWSPASTLNTSTSATVIATPLATTTYTATATVNGCSSTNSVTVTVGTPLVSSPITTSATAYCTGNSITINANSTGGGAPFNYVWSDGNGGVYPNSQSISVNLAAGTYNFSCTISDGCGGTQVSSGTVVINPLPSIVINPSPISSRICGTGSVTLSATGGSTYAWTPATGLSSATSSSPIATPSTTTTYNVVGTDANGCVSSTLQTVVVGPAMTMSSVTASPVCHIGNSQLSASAFSTPSANYSVASIPVSIVTPSAGSTVLATGGVATPAQSGNSLDDGYWDNISLPFSFNFYGNIYSSVRIATNGNVQFGPVVATGGNPGNSSWTAQTIPTSGGNLDNFIAGPWIDQDVSTTPFGTIRYFTEGVSPNRKFVVSYESAHVFSSSDNNTSQIILNENGTIDVLLLGGGLISTAVKAIGVENSNGSLGMAAPGRNSGTWTTLADEAWRFTPPSLNYTWAPSALLSNVGISNPIATNTTSNSTYTVTATDGVSGCSVTGTVTVGDLSTSSSVSTSSLGCYTWPLNNVTYAASGSYTYTMTNANSVGCDSIVTLNLTLTPGVLVASKAILAGPYDANTGLMTDSLRTNNMIPVTEPYSIAPFNKPAIGGPSGESVSPSVLSITGSNAIVDWVYLELRSASSPSTIIATKRALIQRDGDIVSSADGTSPVFFPGLPSGNYYLSIKHRNHLGIMTSTSVNMGCGNSPIDFTTGTVWVKPGEINAPRKSIGSVMAMWPADANNNKNSKYNGLANDKDVISNAVGVGTPNNILGPVYRTEDLNMDSKVKYNNTDNDRNVIANTVGTNTPNNVVNQHTPN